MTEKVNFFSSFLETKKRKDSQKAMPVDAETRKEIERHAKLYDAAKERVIMRI